VSAALASFLLRLEVPAGTSMKKRGAKVTLFSRGKGLVRRGRQKNRIP